MSEAKESKDEAFIEKAKKRFQYGMDQEASVRAEMLDDWKFYHGEQWRSEDRTSREDNNKPCLTISRVDQFVHQIVNDNRQNKVSFKVTPTSAFNAQIQEQRQKSAELRGALIKSINYHSSSVSAIQNAFDHAVIMGRGFFRLITEYVNDKTIDQEIKVKKVQNPLNIVMDPDREEIDYSDCEWGFAIEKMKKEEFEERYPNAEFQSWDVGQMEEFWSNEEEVMVAEYYYFDYESDVLYQVQVEDELKYVYKSELIKDLPESAIKSQRDVEKKVLKWCKMTSLEVLEREDIPKTDRIPIFPIIGKEEKISGQLVISGLIRKAKDSQRMYNYYSSSEAEWLADNTKAQYIGDPRTMEGYEGIWKDSNVRNIAVLPVNTIVENGVVIPYPTKTMPASVPSGFVNGKLGALDDLKGTTGIFDASMGNQGNETSGRAIIARQREGDTSNYHFTDNEGISLTSAGQVMSDWLPVIYDTARILKIVGEDDTEESVELFGTDKNGEEILLGDGYFDVQSSMGPAFSTQREEALSGLLDFMNAYPESRPVIGDLVAGQMDIHNADKIAARLKLLAPPGVVESEDDEQSPQLVAMQQLLQQREQEMQQIMGQLQEVESKSQNEQGKLMIEGEKLKIEQFKADTDRLKAQIDQEKAEFEKGKLMVEASDSSDMKVEQLKAQTQMDIAEMRVQADTINNKMKLDHEHEKQDKVEMFKNQKEQDVKAVIDEQVNTTLAEIEDKMSKEFEDKMEEAEERIKLSEDKTSTVTKQKDGNYKVVTKDGLGRVTTSEVKKKGNKYIIEDK